MAVIGGRGTGGTEIAALSGGSTGRDFFDTVNTITVNASVESFDIFISESFPTNARVKIKFWRPSGGDYVFLGESQLISDLPTGLNTNLTLDAPINVQTGDLFSIWVGAVNGSRVSVVSINPTETEWSGADSDYTSTITQSVIDTPLPDRGLRVSVNGTPSVTDTITPITKDYTFQKESGGSATIPVTFSWTGTPTAIEYSVSGSPYQTGDASPSGGQSTFNIIVPLGENTVTARFSNDTGVNATINNVAALDAFAFLGQSNGSGRGTNNQTWTPNGNGDEAHLYGNDEAYKVLADPYDSNANQVDQISNDSNAAGSYAVRFANDYLANNNRPVGLLPTCKGGTPIAEFAKNSTVRVDGLNMYESMSKRINAVGGVNAVIFDQGENDANDAVGTTLSAYEAALNQLANDIFADFGCKTIVRALQTITAAGYDGNGTTTGQNAIRQAQLNAAASNANIEITASNTDIDLSGGDGLHFKTDADLALVGFRAYSAYNDITPPTQGSDFNNGVKYATNRSLAMQAV